MATATIPTKPVVVDTYLGFEIRRCPEGNYLALPTGWQHGESLQAKDLSKVRKKIWYWWHRVIA